MSAYHDDDTGEACPDCGLPFMDGDCPFDDEDYDRPEPATPAPGITLRLTDPDEQR